LFATWLQRTISKPIHEQDDKRVSLFTSCLGTLDQFNISQIEESTVAFWNLSKKRQEGKIEENEVKIRKEERKTETRENMAR
jgi:hypothetical protein